MSATICLFSRFLPHTIHNRGIKTWQDIWTKLVWSRYVLRRDKVIFDHCSKGYYWTVKGHSEPPFMWCLPIRQEILNVSQIAITLYGIRPTIFIQTRLQQHRRRTFLYSAHCSFCKSHVFLIWVALTYSDSRVILHNTCKIPWNCERERLLVSSSAPGTSLRSSGSPGKFWFHIGRIVTTELPNLVPPRHIDDCYAILFFHWEFCDPMSSSNQNVPLWARLHQRVFCKKPSLFSSSSRYRYLGPSESACGRTVLTRTPFHFCSRLQWEFMRRTWKCLNVQAQGFRVSEGLRSSTKCSLKSCSQSCKSCNRSSCTSSRPSFLFVFSVSVGLCSGFLRSSSLVLQLLSGTGSSVFLLTSNTESCDEDDEEIGVGVVEELVDKPRTTNGTEFGILQSILLHFLVRCGFWPLVQW